MRKGQGIVWFHMDFGGLEVDSKFLTYISDKFQMLADEVVESSIIAVCD